MRGYKAHADQVELKAEIAGLRGQITIVEQRLALASEQQKAAEREAASFKKQLDEVKEKLPQDASKGLFTNLDITLGRLLAANNATHATLTFSGGIGKSADMVIREAQESGQLKR